MSTSSAESGPAQRQTSTSTSTQEHTQTGPSARLVTQFSQPSECSSLFTLVSQYTSQQIIGKSAYNYTTQYLTSDAANSRFSTCQPSGWDSAHFTFSPGLCPSGWKYLNMHAVTTNSATVSQAYCCALTYQLQDKASGTGIPRCQSAGADDQSHTRILAYDAWLVQWQPSDNLPVSLPDIPLGSTALAWQPGQVLQFASTETRAPQPTNDPKGNDMGIGNEYIIIVIVIPIVIFLIIVVSCVFGCRYRRNRKRQGREKAVQAAQGQSGGDKFAEEPTEVKPVQV